MNTSTSIFKGITFALGVSFWFFLITTILNIFRLEILLIFVGSILLFSIVASKKISKMLDILSLYNTKLFLGIVYIIIFSWYGIMFRILKIDLLRINSKGDSYWLDHKNNELGLKQY